MFEGRTQQETVLVTLLGLVKLIFLLLTRVWLLVSLPISRYTFLTQYLMARETLELGFLPSWRMSHSIFILCRILSDVL